MLHDRLSQLFDLIDLDDATPPDVAQWTRLVRALRRDEVQNRALRHAIPDEVFTVSADNRIVDYKPGRELVNAVPPEQFLGRTLAEVLPEALAIQLQTEITEARRSRTVRVTEYALGNREFEARMTSEDGETVIGFVRDITERRTAERELRRNEAIYANLFQHSTDGIILFDTSGTILDINRCALSLFGFERHELVSTPIHELLVEEPAGESSLDPSRIGLSQVVELESRFKRKDGSVFVAEVSATAFLLPDGRVVQAILRDVTERRRFEESLKQAKEEAERANRAKSQFLSNMSHELKTPLNAILGFGRVLARGSYGELSPRQRQYLQDILHSGEHMLDLVNNLLDLRRLEVGEDFLQVSPNALHPMVEEATAIVGPLVESKGQILSVRLPEHAPDVLVDHRAMIRTLVNLLSNAVKYTEQGGHIEVGATSLPDHVCIEVRDSGIGIATTDQERIFDYFEQVRSEDISDISGSGIGLALSRELVERMGGAIGVRSQPGKGSCFHFTVPLATPPGEERTLEPRPKNAPTRLKGLP